MLFKKYNFRCKIVTEALLPPYKRSTFRGVFGLALKEVACPHKKSECGPCELKQKCVYSFAFETGVVIRPADGSVFTSPPVPFFIEPLRDCNAEYALEKFVELMDQQFEDRLAKPAEKAQPLRP